MAIETRELPEGPALNGAEPQEVTSRVERVTPEMAAQWMGTDLYIHQRTLRHSHVRRIAIAIARREFKPGTLEFCVVDGKRYLVDGQHRLMAVVSSETDQTFVLAEYHYATIEQVRDHYGRTDIGIKRAPADAPNFKIFGEELFLSGPQLRAVVSAIPLIAGGFDDSARRGSIEADSPDARYDLARSFKREISKYFRIVNEGRREVRRYLTAAGVLGVGLVTLRDQYDRAVPFWERVAQLAGYEKESGEQHLLAYFLAPKEGHQRAFLAARWVARCWSLSFEEEYVSVVRAPDPAAPIKIAGTHYDGKAVRTL